MHGPTVKQKWDVRNLNRSWIHSTARPKGEKI